MATYPERTVVFPVRMGRIRFHGPHPAAGERLECRIGITSVTDAAVVADMTLIRDGRVWASVTGWQDRRFDSDASTRAASRFPERSTLSAVRPGGWLLVHERWPDLASRELIMRNNLGEPERAEYLRQPPRGRRSWLLGRIAVKDAVRQWLWDSGEGDIFPAELAVGNRDTGQPYVTGRYGRELPPLAVSLAHQHEVGVAIARNAGQRVGIDVTDVTDRPESTRAIALTQDERALLAEYGDTELWFSRFWAAKEAVAKAEGSGLDGAPKRFVVRSATETELTVRVADRDHTVHCADVHNPPTLPGRRYVVAWTVCDEQEGQA
jgi:phosphopantetheinyl transferase